MPTIYPARVEEQIAVTGAGSIATGATPVAGAQTFADACAVGDSFPLYIIDTTTAPITIEQSIGTYSAANTITRTALPGQALKNFGGNQCLVLIGKNPYSDALGSNVDPSTYNWVGNAISPLNVSLSNYGTTYTPGGYPTFFPFMIPVSGKISAISVVVSTASATAGSGAVAALMAPTSGRSSASWSTLIDFTATTQIDLTTAAAQTISNFTPTSVERGLYLLQIIQNPTGANGGALAAGDSLMSDFGFILTGGYALGHNKAISQGKAATSLLSPMVPATDLVNSTSSGIPVVMLGIS